MTFDDTLFQQVKCRENFSSLKLNNHEATFSLSVIIFKFFFQQKGHNFFSPAALRQKIFAVQGGKFQASGRKAQVL
jgi:hypothetical protein